MAITQRIEKLFATDEHEKCFACGKPLGRQPALVNVNREDQNVYVGRECFKCIQAAGAQGWQPFSKGKPRGPRLYLLQHGGKYGRAALRR